MPNIQTPKLPFRPFPTQVSPMSDRPYRSAIALGAWFIAVIGAGSWAAHLFYNGGMALADVARRKPINAPIDWLAGVCSQASFADAHRFAIICTAVLAALPFFPRMLRKPDGPLHCEWADLRADRRGPRQAALGAALCVACALAIAALIHGLSGLSMPTAWLVQSMFALLAAVAVECLFRGVSHRIFSRAIGGKRAHFCTVAAYFLFMSALFPDGIDTWTPALSSERFPLTRSLVSGCNDPAHVLHQSLPLLLLGVSLAWARARSASLWLVIGIQTGVLVSWRMTSHPLPALLAALPAVYVLCDRPSLRASKPS